VSAFGVAEIVGWCQSKSGHFGPPLAMFLRHSPNSRWTHGL